MRIRIFNRQGEQAYTLPVADGSTWAWKLQESEHIIVKCSADRVLSLKKGFYTDIDGLGRFEIVNLPTPSANSKAAGYDYELKMERPWCKFKNRIMFFKRGAVLGMESRWNLTDTIGAHTGIVTDNLASCGFTYKGDAYIIVIHNTVDTSKSVLIQYDGTSILDALSRIAEAFKCEWWVVDNEIHFGRCEQGDTEITLRSGKEICTLSRSEDSNEHGTRLYAFGSNRNLNKNYRRKLKNPFTIDGYHMLDNGDTTKTFVFSFKDFSLPKKAVRESSMMTFENGMVKQIRYVGVKYIDGHAVNDGRELYRFSDGTYILSGTTHKVTLSGLSMMYINRLYTEPIDGQEDTAIQGVADTVLQLPAGTPYLDSPDLDGDDDIVEIRKTYEDIYPRALLTITEVSTVQAKHTDESTGEVTYWTAYRFKAKKSQDNTPFEFDEDYLIQEDGKNLSIHFESGALNGFDFEVHFNPEGNSGEKRLFEITRNNNYSLQLPNETAAPKVGDTLYMYNMDATFIDDSLVSAAEAELKEAAEKDLKELCKDSGAYTAKTNAVEFGRRKFKISYGQKVKLVAPEYFSNDTNSRSSRIIGWELNLDDRTRGEYTVGESKAYSQRGQLQDNVAELVYYNSQIKSSAQLNGVLLATLKKQVANLGEEIETKLSKLTPDAAQGLITFLKGIAFKDKYGISGLGEAVLKSLKLDGAEIDQSGHGTFTGITNLGDIVTKNLTVTGMMHIFTLVIDKVKSAGGAAIFTPADGFTVDKVEPAAGGYRLYWRATDGNGLARDNMWEAGDQALCHTDNRMRAGTAHNASNKLYWCLVTKTGTGVMADISGIPTECNYIDISASDKLAGCVVNPETGDSIVMLGHRGDNKRRKSAIYISAHSSLDPTLQAPLIAQYADIDSFSLDGKATSSLAFDASKGRTVLKVNGDAYIGDGNDNFIRYTPEHGLEVSAVAHFKAGTTGGENIDGISASGANLIVNSGFTGNYESIEVSESTPVSGETPVFSPALFGWSGTAIVSKDADSASGFSASLSGAISQAIPTIVPGLPYAFTAKAKGRDITVSVGGVERIFRLSGQYQTISFVAVPAVGESFSMSGDCTVCEPMLVSGRTLAAWQPGAQDNDRSMGELHALRSLTEAIQQSSTRVVGGFVLTQTVKVGNYRNKVLTEETGGMSGYRVSDNSPYIWGGGTLAQAHYTINKYAADPSYQATEEELKKMAKFVVTHGGRAILNDMILRGYVYAEGGVFKNVSSPNGNFMITETGDVKIKGEINASSGKIAGIEIHGNYLGSEIKRDANGNIIPWSGPNGRFGLYSDMISFSSPDGRQVILGTWNNFGVPLMVRMSDNRPDFMPKYGIVFDIANSAFGQNYAFIGRGNGILNGVMDSYRYRRLILAEDNTVYNINDPQSGNRVFVFTDKDHTDVSLPKLSAMKVFLGMSADSTEPFSIPLVIMGDLKTKGFSVFGRNDRKVRDKDGKETKPWAGDEYPLIVSYNVAEWLPTVGMAEGDVLEFMLTYDPGRDSESDRIDGKTIIYTARLIRFLQ